MDPFEHFLRLKPEIERNNELMSNLNTYAFSDRIKLDDKKNLEKQIFEDRIPLLGRGDSNVHFRVGKLGDLWIATREHMRATNTRFDGNKRIELQRRGHCEVYIKELLAAHSNGLTVPTLCGGVEAVTDSWKRYFLLVEDLTQGGKYEVYPGRIGYEFGEVNWKRVFYDFETNYDADLDKFDYMVTGKMIQLRQ